jgi:hypothetical protein
MPFALVPNAVVSKWSGGEVGVEVMQRRACARLSGRKGGGGEIDVEYVDKG